MARQDIHVDAVYGEVNTSGNLTNKVIYDFILLGEMPGLDNERYLYAEISVPSDFEKRYSDKNGIHINIPYTPSYKELMIRFCLHNGDGQLDYMLNKSDNKHWFKVYVLSKNIITAIRLSELQQLNEDGNFNLIFNDNKLNIYSGAETDFLIKAAKGQNEVFLLKAMAGNLYQYPTIGVGLIEFLHGNFENSGLAEKLQSEFKNDQMVINNAYMDSETGELFLEVEEKNG
ncbi:hypothetical protein [Dysgonomonas sp. GY617]|uniref:hypothetical protein n=1 Tax=Dysgonomonas sp. GY617 TaxID=2780420 RepID=UPI0018835C1C|nr:hypothetical protein [Dysgonomonas sp. GY617]MBF0575544.1 hypothetical protein [Dysgonomonas sp. GY617]